MRGYEQAQRNYDAALPSDFTRRAEREYEPSLEDAPDAIRCHSFAEANELRRQFPGREIIIVSKTSL